MGKINLTPVKNSLATAAASATFLAFSVSLLATNFTIEFFSSNPKLVDLSIESLDVKTGDFSGEAVTQNGRGLWEVNGTMAGNKVEIEFSNLKDDKRIVATGEIQKDGTIAGRAATEDGELFEWEATDALTGPISRA